MQDPQVPGPSSINDPYAASSVPEPYPPAANRTQPYPPQSYPAGQTYGQTYSPPGSIVPADQGLSDTAAGALAYITIIPAILFLVMPPYNTRPFVKFHAFQCLGLAALGVCLGIVGIIPILGQIIFLVGWLAMLVVWVLSLVKASQGSYLQLPVISEFASRQSGHPIA